MEDGGGLVWMTIVGEKMINYVGLAILARANDLLVEISGMPPLALGLHGLRIDLGRWLVGLIWDY